MLNALRPFSKKLRSPGLSTRKCPFCQVAPKNINRGFVEAGNPQFAIVFAVKSSRDKPNADLLTTLASSTILDTDRRGSIGMIVDGASIAIKTTS